MVTDWPLVGRQEELAFALDALEDEASSGLVLAGLAGVGKTRLAAEVFAALQAQGRHVVACSVTRAIASIPFGAVVDLIPGLHGSMDNQLDVLRSVAAALTPVDGLRTVVGLDDAHLADDATAALLHHLVTRRLVTLVATVRTGEAANEAITALWKDGHCRRLDVQALARDEVNLLLAAVLDGPVDSNTVDRVWRLSEGNALLVRELVVQAVDDGTLTQRMGFWQWTGDVQPGARLTDIVGSGVGRLSEEERHVIALLAYGEPIGAAALREMADPAAVARLLDRGVVRVDRQRRRENVWLAHPLYGDVVRADTGQATAANVVRILADDLQRRGPKRSGDAGRLGRWAIEGGLPITAEVLEAAAVGAYRASDFKLAEQLARADPDWARHATGYVLGSALAVLERNDEAADVLAVAAVDPPTDELRARIAYHRIELLCYRMQRHDEVADVFADAMATIEDPVWRDLLAAAWAPTLVFLGRRAEALALLAPMVDAPEDRTRLAAMRGLSFLLIPAGDTTRMLALCDELLAPAFELRGEWEYGLNDVVSARIMALFMEGRLREVGPILEMSEDFVDAERDPSAFSFVHMGWARLALFAGQPVTAVKRLRQALAGFEGLERGVRGPWGLRLLAEACALTGDIEGAETALVDARATDGPLRTPFASDGARAEAWVAVASGEHERARAELLAEAGVARDLGQFGYEALVLHDAARLGGAEAVASRLQELAGVVDGPITRVYADHASAAATADGDGLERASVRFEELGFNLLAAESIASAAAAHRRAGLIGRTSAALARVAALRLRCEGAFTPALVADADVVALTRREREVATLAAGGLASKGIAEALHLSSRTVDNHLQHAYDKLGVRRREELTEVLGLESE